MNRGMSICMFFLAFMSVSFIAGEIEQEPPDDKEEVIVYKFDIKKMIAAPVWRTTKLSLKEASEIGADYIPVSYTHLTLPTN